MGFKKFLDVRLIAFSILIDVLCIAGLIFGKKFYMPFDTIQIDNVSDVVNDENGNSYIINNGGTQIVRMDANGDASLVIDRGNFTRVGFENADAVAVDAEGNIYIHNRIYHKNAISWYGGENIRIYNSKGRYLKTVNDIRYDTPVLECSVSGLENVNGWVYSYMLSKDKILVSNVLNGDIVSYDFKAAKILVADICYAADKNCLFVALKDGRLLKLVNGKEPEIVYEADQATKPECYFPDISYNQKTGELYVCDIISRAVYRLDGLELICIHAPSEITYNVDATKGIVFNHIYSVVREEKGRYFGVSSLVFSNELKRNYVIGLIWLIFCFLMILYAFICAGYYLIYEADTKQKTITAFSVAIAIITVGFCALVANEMKTMMIEQTKEDEQLVIKLINSGIDENAFKSLDSVADFNSEGYNRVKKVIESILLDENGAPGALYAVLYTLEPDGSVMQRYDLSGSNGCNYPYIWATGEEEAYIYETGETIAYDQESDMEGNFQFLYAPILDKKNNVIGIMEIGCDVTSFNKSINERIFMVALAILAISVVFILLLLEIIEFNETRKTFTIGQLKEGTFFLPVKMYRIIVFVIFFAINITTPFLAIYSLSLAEVYSQRFGVSAEILSALPISAEVVGGALLSMCGGFILAKTGNRKGSVLGGILFTIGLLIRVLYPDLMIMTIGNFIQGAGWGILLLVVNSQIAMYPDEKEVEQGFVDYNIAFQNGVNSGIVFGGFLLSFCGYVNIMVISVIISLLPLVYVISYIYDSVKEQEEKEEKLSAFSYVKFICSPRVLAYFFLIVIPVISASCYLNYLYPIIADSFGLQENLIGYSYLLNGLVVICFGNIIVNIMSKHFNKIMLLGIASVIYMITFVLMGAFENVIVLLASLILIAISDSFGYVAQSFWYAESQEVNELGYERALGVYSLFENLSQAAGSFVLGYILVMGIGKGLIVYGLIIGAAGVVFILFSTVYGKFLRGKA